MPSPIDIKGSPVAVGSTVRLLSLSGQWLEELPAEERFDVMSMVGEIFVVEEIDEYGHPWVRKSWPNEAKVSATLIQLRSSNTKWRSLKMLSNIPVEALLRRWDATPASRLRAPHLAR